MKRWPAFAMTQNWDWVPSQNEVPKMIKGKTNWAATGFPKVIFKNSRSNVLFKFRPVALITTGGNTATARWRLEERNESDAIRSTNVMSSVWLGRRPILFSVLPSSGFCFAGESDNPSMLERHADERDKSADFEIGCNVARVEWRA